MKTILIVVLFTGVNLSQDKSITKLFPGKWMINIDKSEYYEEWQLINETEMMGVGFSIEEGDTVLSEKLFLKKFGGIWAYVALPVNQTITLFALTEYSEKRFIFENDEHNYPQKIIYEFVSDSVLNAAVEGKLDGELMRRDFSFIKID